MPTVYVKLWNHHDQEVLWPYTYGKNGKKRQKPAALKPSWWSNMCDRYADLCNIVRGK
jgi:hypothetical protein